MTVQRNKRLSVSTQISCKSSTVLNNQEFSKTIGGGAKLPISIVPEATFFANCGDLTEPRWDCEILRSCTNLWNYYCSNEHVKFHRFTLINKILVLVSPPCFGREFGRKKKVKEKSFQDVVTESHVRCATHGNQIVSVGSKPEVTLANCNLTRWRN